MSLKIKANAQAGFTLIELIAVIVILGILAATALPKFVNLTGDARYASLQGAKAALGATSGMLHAKYYLNPAANGSAITVEGVTVPMENGYPQAKLAFATAAGVTSPDYVVAEVNGKITVAPKDGNRDTCKVTYEGAWEAGMLPAIRMTASSKGCE